MKKILIFGCYNTDLCVRVNQFPQPGETLMGSGFAMGPGGKAANQAVAAKRAGADVVFVTKLGRDAFGEKGLAFFAQEGLSTDAILFDEKEASPCAVIMINDKTAQNQIVISNGACGKITENDTALIAERLQDTGIFLTQLETNPEPVYKLMHHAKTHGILSVLNPAPAADLPADMYRDIDIITPNETEAESLTGVHIEDEVSAARAADILFRRGVGKVIITMGSMGVFAADGQESRLIPARKVRAVDTTGAGDCFSGVLVSALSRDMAFFDAVRYAVCASSISVSRQGAAPSMPYKEEIDSIYL